MNGLEELLDEEKLKQLAEALQAMSPEEQEKVIKEMGNVILEEIKAIGIQFAATLQVNLEEAMQKVLRSKGPEE